MTHWSLGIVDQTPGGWMIVGMYLVASVSCWRLARKIPTTSHERHEWRSIAVLFSVLGIIRLLDLPTAATEDIRHVAFSEGWYAQRQVVQLPFIVLIALSCVTVAIVSLIRARTESLPTSFALMGATFVMAFVMIRAASFHPVDQFIGKRLLGLSWNAILETGGIGLVFVMSQLRSFRTMTDTSITEQP